MGESSNDNFAEQRKAFEKKMGEAKKVGGTRLILVVVANILDPHIGKGCAKDIESIRQMFTAMAEHMDFWFLEFVIKGDDYNIKNVLKSIELIEPGDDDIVVFYYTGHGFRFEKEDDEKYPHVYLQPTLPKATDSIINENSLNLSEIFEKVKARGARLNIVIGDCCNNLIHFQRKFTGGDQKVKSEPVPAMKIDKEMCKALFCDQTASILIASADKGQFSITDDDLGSIFTFNFTKNLKILLSSPKEGEGLAWAEFLQRSQEKTFNLSKTYNIGSDTEEKPGHQKPIFKVFSK